MRIISKQNFKIRHTEIKMWAFFVLSFVSECFWKIQLRNLHKARFKPEQSRQERSKTYSYWNIIPRIVHYLPIIFTLGCKPGGEVTLRKTESCLHIISITVPRPGSSHTAVAHLHSKKTTNNEETRSVLVAIILAQRKKEKLKRFYHNKYIYIYI